ncbi:hypothetical protein QQZ08_005415 [Neonectria magnoliae]|uniref:Uncharacterized protein n=1 Tax=Neonectria magnoliae TaxID=2732573 RepID=A0ABR1I4M7_9HYPO
MADAFFTKAPSTFANCNITRDQIVALQSCVNGEITPEDAAKLLTTYPEASPTPLELQQRLAGLWTLLNDTAVGIMSAQPKIITILQVIRTFPKVEEPKGEGEGYMDFDDGFFWRELTGWANDWADNYNYYGARFKIEPSQGQERADRKQAWISANAYTARLASTGDLVLTSCGAALERAKYAIEHALERDHGDEEPNDLEAAAQLFIHAAQELHRLSKEGPQTEGTSRPGGLWHGQEGYSIERWTFWMERWSALAGVESFSTQARTAAGEALKSMQEG